MHLHTVCTPKYFWDFLKMFHIYLSDMIQYDSVHLLFLFTFQRSDTSTRFNTWKFKHLSVWFKDIYILGFTYLFETETRKRALHIKVRAVLDPSFKNEKNDFNYQSLSVSVAPLVIPNDGWNVYQLNNDHWCRMYCFNWMTIPAYLSDVALMRR